MDIISNGTLVSASEYAVIMAVVGVLTQIAKKSGYFNSKTLPFVSMILGVVVGLFSVYYTKDTNYLNGAIEGLLLGASTSGLVDGVSSVSTAVANKKDAKTQAKNDLIVTATQEAVQALLNANPVAPDTTQAPTTTTTVASVVETTTSSPAVESTTTTTTVAPVVETTMSSPDVESTTAQPQ